MWIMVSFLPNFEESTQLAKNPQEDLAFFGDTFKRKLSKL
jgi:hypothetical protein